MISRIVRLLLVLMLFLSGCVFVGPKLTAVVPAEGALATAHEKYKKAERVIEDAGFRRVLFVDSEGRNTQPRIDDPKRLFSSFTREQDHLRRTGVNLVLDKKSTVITLEVWDFPPEPTLSSEAHQDFEQLLVALKGALGPRP